jgi:predicted transcriptional regulator
MEHDLPHMGESHEFRQLQIRLSADLYDRLDAQATERIVSKRYLVERAIASLLDRLEGEAA